MKTATTTSTLTDDDTQIKDKQLPVGRLAAKVPQAYNPWAVMTNNPWGPYKPSKQES